VENRRVPPDLRDLSRSSCRKMRQKVDDPPLVALLGRSDQTSMSRARPLRRCVCLPANPSTNHLYGPRLSRQTQNVQTDRCLATKKPGKRLGPARRTLLMGRSGCRKFKSLSLPTGCEGLRRTPSLYASTIPPLASWRGPVLAAVSETREVPGKQADRRTAN